MGQRAPGTPEGKSGKAPEEVRRSGQMMLEEALCRLREAQMQRPAGGLSPGESEAPEAARGA